MPPLQDTSPKRNGTGRTPNRTGGKSAPKTPTASKADIAKALEQYTNMVGFGFQVRGQDFPALVMTHTGPAWAASMAELAEQDPRLKRMLTLLTQGGVMGAAVLSTGVMVLPILAYYQALPLPPVAVGAVASLPANMVEGMTDEDRAEMGEAWNAKFHPEGVPSD